MPLVTMDIATDGIFVWITFRGGKFQPFYTFPVRQVPALLMFQVDKASLLYVPVRMILGWLIPAILVSHSRCIDGLDILFLVVAELVGDGQRATNPVWRRIHVEVLVALYGARLEPVVGEVAALQEKK